MAILDVFTSIFVADTDGLKEGYSETERGAKNITEELRKAEKQSDATGDSLISMAKKAAGFLLAAVAAGKSISTIIDEAANISRVSDFSNSVDSSIESVDAFSKSLIALGGSQEEAETALSNLFSSVKAASTDANSSASKVFASLGVSVKNASGQTRELFSVLGDVSESVSKMDSRKAKEYIEALGITDRATVEAILQGRKELENLMRTQKEMGVISEKSAEKARAFDKSVGALSNAFQRSKRSVTEAILPALTWVVEKFASLIEWANRNKEVVSAAFIAIASAVAIYFIPAMVSAAASVLAATWPLILIIGIIAAVGVAIWALYDDFQHFKDGNNSFIGEMLERYPALGRAMKQTFEMIGNIIDWVVDLFVWLGEQIGISFDGVDGSLGKLLHFFFSFLDKIFEFGEILVGSVKYSFGLLKDIIVGALKGAWELIEPIINAIKGGIDAVMSPIDWLGKKTGLWGGDVEVEHTATMKGVGIANAILEEASNEPLNNISTNSIVANNTKSNEITMNVSGVTVETNATDANGVALGLAGNLTSHIQDILEASATGLERG